VRPFSVGYGMDRGRFETASVIVPVTMSAGEKLWFNLNGGWLWTRAEIALRKNLNLMVETFTRDEGKVGGQASLRWTRRRGGRGRSRPYRGALCRRRNA
jgi:hypothetical protein